ncbi:zinc ribbon domain-containing protein [Acidovorax sp. GW101-3H11]|jgi:hypothetical protein|uniref:zinc ribbon domain-containing protein n=1 Tax=Acidovorax sp. GW101-3H11 TaxID=1813946 RepID=UPI000D6D4CF1|nr:zinc ribbon domain-containing protein [Acidovorax sp. GW101-3H11]
MALVKCFECGKEISDKASACPGCGAPVVLQKPIDEPAASAKPSPSIGILLVAAVSVGMMAFVVVSCVGGKDDTKSADEFTWNDALTLCQMSLKNASRDPEKADVPYVENFGKGDEFYYAWGPSTKMARMRNGLGIEVATTASCVVSKSQKRITSLTLDGKTIR